MFLGFDSMRVLTYSVSTSMIVRMLDEYSFERFERFECVFGSESVLGRFAEVIAFQQFLVNQVRQVVLQLKDDDQRAVLEQIHEGKARFYVVKDNIAHSKLYLLENGDPGRRRVIVGSANLSERCLMIYTNTSLPTHKHALADTLHSSVEDIRNRLTTDLYRRYLSVVMDKLDAEPLPGDILRMSSETICDLMDEAVDEELPHGVGLFHGMSTLTGVTNALPGDWPHYWRLRTIARQSETVSRAGRYRRILWLYGKRPTPSDARPSRARYLISCTTTPPAWATPSSSGAVRSKSSSGRE